MIGRIAQRFAQSLRGDGFSRFSTIVSIASVALGCMALIVSGIRRCACGGELGGSVGGRVTSVIVLIALWVAFVTLVALQVYTVIDVDISGVIKMRL